MTAAMASAALITLLSAAPYHPAPLELSDSVADLLAGLKLQDVRGLLPRPVVNEGPVAIRDLICTFDWPCAQAVRVATCESTLNPRAISTGGHLGLFQLAPMHAWRVGGDANRLLNATDNIAAAYGLWQVAGWGPWSCKP